MEMQYDMRHSCILLPSIQWNQTTHELEQSKNRSFEAYFWEKGWLRHPAGNAIGVGYEAPEALGKQCHQCGTR